MNMSTLIMILIAVIVGASLIVVIMLIKGAKSKDKTAIKKTNLTNSVQKKGKGAVIKECEKKLVHDPHNVAALEALGDIYYTDKNWEKVWGIYKTLYEISTAHIEISIPKVTRRMGVAAYYLKKYDDAINSLLISLKKEPESVETNMFLGKSLLEKNTFDKAAICFKKCRLLSPDNTEANEMLASTLFKSQKFREALPYLKRALEEHPDNKEMLYNMGVAMTECGLGDKALKIFVHLRPDPVFGAQSCLEAGKMHERVKNFQAAIADYEIALKLINVPDQILTQIKYHCANDYIATNNIPKGLTILKQLQTSHPGYKDVDALVTRYQELNQNQNLQTYLLSGTSDFVALCRKFIAAYFKEAFVKVEDVTVASETIEIICSVESDKWESKDLFRFYRSSTVIGDIYVREFHSKMRDSKCDNGFCVTMGTFSESAHKYIDGRPIDLIEKDELVKILKRINMFS